MFSVPNCIDKIHQVVVPVEGPDHVVVGVHAGESAGISGFLVAFGLRVVLNLTESYPIKKLLQLFETGIEIPEYAESPVIKSIIHALGREGIASLSGT